MLALFWASVAAAALIMISVPVTDSNLAIVQSAATNQGYASAEAFLSNRVEREIQDQRYSKMLTLWAGATFAQQEAALAALRGP